MANDFINNYFGFNRQQRNGLYVLVLISFLLLVTRLVYPLLITPGTIVVKDLPLFERKLDSASTLTKNSNKQNYFATQKKSRLFVFDPNTVSLEQLIQLGFSEKKAGTFLKFRNRGFVFKEKKDLQKVYGISGNFYENLEPYILIPSKSGKPVTVINEIIPKKEIPNQKKNIPIIELNSADSASLETLNGIGSAYAKRILKYRNVLGGYSNIGQLKEVYGFNEELYEKIRPFVSVNPASIKKLNINKDDFKTINKHPYLSYELTKTIFDFRRKTPITSANLKELLNDNSLYEKLLPYLVFE